ncbi:MAG: hypothetical protein U0X75_21850 [Acidobacteriota bacterium]
MDADGEHIQDSLRGVFDFLRKQGAQYGIDAARLGVYAASANVRGAYEYLIGEHAASGIVRRRCITAACRRAGCSRFCRAGLYCCQEMR